MKPAAQNFAARSRAACPAVHPISLLWRTTLVAVAVGAGLRPLSGRAQEAEKESRSTKQAWSNAGAQPDEFVILKELKGVVLLPNASLVKSGPFTAGPGFDATQVPMLPPGAVAVIGGEFIGRPASRASLDRIALSVRLTLVQLAHPFVAVFVPPQDVTEGWVQIVAQLSVATPTLGVDGARYFSPDLYRSAIRQQPGEPIDVVELAADIDWLNRNPFRRVTTVVRPGAKAGSTELALRVDERLPLRLSLGYSNTGSLVSDEDRVSAGVTWGNALGRGDQLGYQYSASPDAKTSVTHSANYSADLPWRHTLRVFGAYSELVGRVAAPLSLHGRTWQAGLRYEIPLRPLRPTITQGLALGFDFKSSDNNLLFAAFPITDNVTHVAQFTAAYDLGFSDRWGRTNLGLAVFASPGGLTSRNHTGAFRISRAGARPDYVYGQLSVQRQTRLPHGLTWSIRGQLQVASANLLGSEQMAGGGSASVRGYEEGEAYGDDGLLLSHELALPSRSLAQMLRTKRWSDSLQLFAFEDYVVLRSAHRLPLERRTTDLHSLGLGLRYRLAQNVSLDVTRGWQLRESGVSRSGDRSRTHVSLQASF